MRSGVTLGQAIRSPIKYKCEPPTTDRRLHAKDSSPTVNRAKQAGSIILEKIHFFFCAILRNHSFVDERVNDRLSKGETLDRSGWPDSLLNRKKKKKLRKFSLGDPEEQRGKLLVDRGGSSVRS